MEIGERKILYKSPVYFTPLLSGELVDAVALRQLIGEEYCKAGIRREDVDTGAIIITGETSRKENAEAVLHELSGFAGEFGHINAFDNEVLCRCGKKGCLETEASGSALYRILLERIRNGENSVLYKRVDEDEASLTLEEIISAINQEEDLLCIEIVEEIGKKLGKQIAGLINIFNPDLVIVGGTLSFTGDYIMHPLKTAMKKYSLNLVNKDSVIRESKLKEKAGVWGACMLARNRMFEC
jgi:ethanolamine utilization protein EutA (predicted chaperonin)